MNREPLSEIQTLARSAKRWAVLSIVLAVAGAGLQLFSLWLRHSK